MIGIIIKGGLCNQLFMLFAGISYAIDNSIDYFIYPTLIAKNYFNNFFKEINNKINTSVDIYYNKYNEPHFHYKKIPIQNDIIIEGFYQSDKYFKHNYDKIIDILKIKEKRNLIKNNYPDDYFNNTIAIHFRIGDYYGLQYNHPILKVEYYKKALIYLNSINDITNYKKIIFCQECDNDIIDEYLKFFNLSNVIKIDHIINDYDQLLIMSLCTNFIIANSTFSWFGAYLSDNNNKIVCYPSKWFGEGLKNNNTNDLCPLEWIKI